ncbi:hypothetical protein [Nitrospira sp. BLG_2]|uniref:hypothetical protein n=1 Tax=Nitrospira sp. BLG_2 TaxID=3397507 RepID=UPI003B9A2A08
MRSLVQGNGHGLKVALCMVMATVLGACAQLKSGSSQMTPPTQATPEQAAERERESQPPKVVQARPNGSNPQPCLINFDDEGALEHIYGQARSTLAFRTGRIGFGPLQMCDPSKHNDCWAYRQRCSRSDVTLDAIGLTHFHLNMETGIECYTLPDPGDGFGKGFGKLVDFKCTDVDWTKTPRVLSSHDRNQWVKLWASNVENRAPTYFDLESISVLSDTSIQLWFRKRDGTWWFWPELKADRTWHFREHVRDVSEVRIRGAKSGRASSYVIGSVVVRD